MDRKTLWKTVLEELEVSLSPLNFKGWIRDTKLVGLEQAGNERVMATIACRNPYHRENVENRYYGQIKQVLDRITGKRHELVFTVQPEEPRKVEQIQEMG